MTVGELREKLSGLAQYAEVRVWADPCPEVEPELVPVDDVILRHDYDGGDPYFQIRG